VKELRQSVDSQDSQNADQEEKGRNTVSTRVRADSFIEYQSRYSSVKLLISKLT